MKAGVEGSSAVALIAKQPAPALEAKNITSTGAAVNPDQSSKLTHGAAERFFDERAVPMDTSSAQSLVQGLAHLFESKPVLHSPGLNIPEAKRDYPDTAYFFRGQSDARHGLKSSLYRAVEPQLKRGIKPAYVEKLMREAERRVIDHARNKEGIGRNLTDLELLTVLQHHLAPTRLIDVSTSWQVGLYFACELDDSIDARLFAIALKPSSWLEYPRSRPGDLSWPDLPRKPWQRTVWPILLPFTDPRMVAQQGYFLAGGLATNTGEHQQYWRRSNSAEDSKPKPLSQAELRTVSTLMIKFPAKVTTRDFNLSEFFSQGWSAVGLTVRIPGRLKRGLREILQEQYGIHEDSIYPPIDESVRALKLIAERSN